MRLVGEKQGEKLRAQEYFIGGRSGRARPLWPQKCKATVSASPAWRSSDQSTATVAFATFAATPTSTRITSSKDNTLRGRRTHAHTALHASYLRASSTAKYPFHRSHCGPPCSPRIPAQECFTTPTVASSAYPCPQCPSADEPPVVASVHLGARARSCPLSVPISNLSPPSLTKGPICPRPLRRRRETSLGAAYYRLPIHSCSPRRTSALRREMSTDPAVDWSL